MNTIKVVANPAPKFKADSARVIWYAAIRKFNNKPVDSFVEAMKEKPPVLTKAGKGEPPMGWVRYFEREGMIKIA